MIILLGKWIYSSDASGLIMMYLSRLHPLHNSFVLFIQINYVSLMKLVLAG